MATTPSPISGVTALCLRQWLKNKFGEEQMRAWLQQPTHQPDHVRRFTDEQLACQEELPDGVLLTVLTAVQSAAQPIDDLMLEFGRFFLLWLVEHTGYEQPIWQVSDTFIGFARCLNRLLVQMYSCLGSKKSHLPEAQITDIMEGSFTLGIIVPSATSAAAKAFIGIYQGMLGKVADMVFGVQVYYSGAQDKVLPTGRLYRSCRVEILGMSPDHAVPAKALAVRTNSVPSPLTDHCITGLDPETFNKLFPFHFALDMDFKVLQTGSALRKLLPKVCEPGVHIQDVLVIKMPSVLWNLECLRGVLENDVSVKVVVGSPDGPDLCGGLHRVQQMQRVDGSRFEEGAEALLFIGSPYLSSLEDMEMHNLYLSDFPAHEQAPEQVLMAAAKQSTAAEALQEAQQSNYELRETLAEALAAQTPDMGGRPKLSISSAGHSLLDLLDTLLMGGDVDAQQVLVARNALLRAGNNVWKPLEVDWSQAALGDTMINKSLAQMLGTQDDDETLTMSYEDDFRQSQQSTGQQGTRSILRSHTPSQASGRRRPAASRRGSYCEGATGSEPRRASFLLDSAAVGNFMCTSYSANAPVSGVQRKCSRQSSVNCDNRKLSGHGSAAHSDAVVLQHSNTPCNTAMLPLPNNLVVAQPETLATLGGDTPDAEANSADTTCASWLKATFSCFKLCKGLNSHRGSSNKVAAAELAELEMPQATADSQTVLKAACPVPPLSLPGGPDALKQTDSGCRSTVAPSSERSSHSHSQPTADGTAALIPVARSKGSFVSGKKRIDNTPAVIKVLAQPNEELTAVLGKADEWQWDAFALDLASGGRPLSTLGFYLMNRMNLIKTRKLDATKLARFLTFIEEGYGDNQYHSRIHAADVLRSFHIMLTRGGVLSTMAKHSAATPATSTGPDEEHQEDNSLQLFTCYLAAIVHDYEHRGVNNDFLIKTSDPLALMYNDFSPMENHHAAAASMLMHQERFAFMPKLGKKAHAAVRKGVIDLVLATDMKQHFAITSSFQHKVTTALRPAIANMASPSNRSFGIKNGVIFEPAHSVSLSGAAPPTDAWDRDKELLALKMVMKAADLGHLASSMEVHKVWVTRLEEELFCQGDRERALGQPVSPLMDRTKAGIQKSQCGFFSVVALPMFQSFVQAFPECQAIVTNMENNFKYWKELEAAASGHK